jgi:hypothetical protein
VDFWVCYLFRCIAIGECRCASGDEIIAVNEARGWRGDQFPKTGGVHNSNSTLSVEKHLAALKDGAREISNNTVIYKQGGKMYMYDYQDEANTEAAENFQSQFDNDY